jgi:hypothetical protein
VRAIGELPLQDLGRAQPGRNRLHLRQGAHRRDTKVGRAAKSTAKPKRKARKGKERSRA